MRNIRRNGAVNEKGVIKRCQNGDKLAFDELIRFFYPYVSKYLTRLTCDYKLTEDLTQETFLKVIRSIDRYDPDGSAGFGTYIITIAKNSYIDFCRKNRVELYENIDDLGGTEPPGSSNFEEDILRKLDYENVLGYINDLPPDQSAAIKLKYIDELTLKEIAELTGVPPKTVKSRIHEGVKKLRKRLSRKGRIDNG